MVGMAPGRAQAQEAGTRIPVPHEQVLSANPFLLLWEWVNVEYERKMSPTTTWGISGGRIAFDDGEESYNSLHGFLRYYPQGAALSGFSLGGRLGLHHVTDEEDDDSENAFGLGVDIGYSWLLGADRNFYIGIGVGATRLFGGDVGSDRVVIPSVRVLNIGWAF
jgi:hypothetical protein